MILHHFKECVWLSHVQSISILSQKRHLNEKLSIVMRSTTVSEQKIKVDFDMHESLPVYFYKDFYLNV